MRTNTGNCSPLTLGNTSLYRLLSLISIPCVMGAKALKSSRKRSITSTTTPLHREVKSHIHSQRIDPVHLNFPATVEQRRGVLELPLQPRLQFLVFQSAVENVGTSHFYCAQKLFIAAHEQASVHNFSLFFVFHQHFHVLEFGRVFVDRNGSGAAGRIHEDQPLSRIFGEIQKIGLIIHLEIQLKSPPKSCHGLQRI